MTIPVLVTTCDKTIASLRPFAYLFTQFWGTEQPVMVAGETRPKWALPDNFQWWSYGKPWPSERWSNGLIKCLKDMPAEVFILLLDDYWLCRWVDREGIALLAEFMQDTPDILRLDLTDDRQYAGDMTDVGYCGHFDLVSTPGDSPYQLSLQAAIWRKSLLLSILVPNWSPWEVELSGSPSLHQREDCRVLGTRQRPVRYGNVSRQGQFQQDEWLRIPREQREYIEAQGWLP